jgi:membrane associated rhomboid family serine protease
MIEYLHFAPIASFIFAITLITSIMTFSNPEWFGKLMFHPYSVHRNHKAYTMITSGLIHRDYMHLIFNMLSFFWFAFTLEATIGHWQFAVLYVASLIISDLPSLAKHKNDISYYTLGASGAISAVVFSFIMYQPMAMMMIIPLPIPIPAILFGVLYLIYCHYASKYARDHINHDAHLFGAFAGVAITLILNPSLAPEFIHKVTEGVRSLLH